MRYIHDCKICKPLGKYKEFDLYVCKALGHITYIARYGNDGPEYKSCWKDYIPTEELMVAVERTAVGKLSSFDRFINFFKLRKP